MFTFALLAALAQAAPEPEAQSGLPPEQVLASIDSKGNLTITYVTCHCPATASVGPGLPAPEEKGPAKAPARPRVKITSVTVTTAELSAKHVEAYTAAGRTIPAETLKTLLAKERTVLVVMDGKKLDPFFLQLYKEDTIVLVPPANTLNPGGFAAEGGYVPPVVVPAPPSRPMPEDRRKPE